MAQSKVFTNKDLNKPITNSKSKIYTNADLKDDFEQDDFEPDNVEDDFESDTTVKTESTAKPINENEPSDWTSGFINSVMSGDAFSGTSDSLLGYAKGIPQGIWGGLKTAGNLALASSGPLGELITGKSVGDRGREFIDMVANIPNAIRGMANVTMQSGNNPEAFGELMGELTGAPLATHGLVKGAPMATRLSGYPVELLGKGVKRYGVGMPRIFESRLQRGIERGVGSGIESVGKMMKGVGTTRRVAGELVTEDMPSVINGEYTIKGPKELPPSKVFHYGEKSSLEDLAPKFKMPDKFYQNLDNYVDDAINQFGSINDAYVNAMKLSKDSSIPILAQQYWKEIAKTVESYKKPNLNIGLQEGQELTPKSYKVIRNESTKVDKPKFRTNRDGTFTNMETGEVLDSKGQSIVEINGKPIDMNKTLDKNSPFFTRNRRP